MSENKISVEPFESINLTFENARMCNKLSYLHKKEEGERQTASS